MVLINNNLPIFTIMIDEEVKFGESIYFYGTNLDDCFYTKDKDKANTDIRAVAVLDSYEENGYNMVSVKFIVEDEC